MNLIEIKAEVYRVIRANMDKPKSAILKAIREHLPKVSKDQIAKVLQELSEG